MLGLSWTELLVVGIVALIVIGPKDLPVVMGRIGKVIGQIQRLGRDFQREINKTTGLDEVRNLRSSITDPLKKTADEIRKEFNAIGKDGQQTPTGALKPTDPNVESVADAIKEKAGIAPVKKTNDQIAAEAGFKPKAATPVPGTKTTPPTFADTSMAKATAEPAAKPMKAAASKTVAAKKAAAAPAKPARVRAAKAAAPKPDAEVAPARKPRTKAAAAAAPAPETVPAPKKPRAPRKKPAETVEKS